MDVKNAFERFWHQGKLKPVNIALGGPPATSRGGAAFLGRQMISLSLRGQPAGLGSQFTSTSYWLYGLGKLLNLPGPQIPPL